MLEEYGTCGHGASPWPRFPRFSRWRCQLAPASLGGLRWRLAIANGQIAARTQAGPTDEPTGLDGPNTRADGHARRVDHNPQARLHATTPAPPSFCITAAANCNDRSNLSQPRPAHFPIGLALLTRIHY